MLDYHIEIHQKPLIYLKYPSNFKTITIFLVTDKSSLIQESSCLKSD